MKRTLVRRTLATLALAAVILTAAACSSMYPNDKMWIPKEKFAQAKTIYDQTDSLALTREKLEADPKWRHAEVNEAVYRLRKLYRLEENK